jgi:glutathione synthase
MEQGDPFLADGRVHASMRPLSVRDDPNGWFTLGEPETLPLASLDTVLMRKDPPLDLEYFYSTYLLELAEREGCLIVNRPQAVRDANEKLFAARFPDCCPPLLVTRDMARIRAFLNAQGDIVVKPLDGMGGASVFRLREGDPNTGVILETSTDHGRRTVMAQRFLPEYVNGDKRILLIDGEPVPQALARIPAAGESRANLAAGGTGVGVDLSERDRFICAQVGPVLREKGLLFVGIDVIGDYLTEINVTSPTCIRELDRIYDLDIAGTLMDAIARRLGR